MITRGKMVPSMLSALYLSDLQSERRSFFSYVTQNAPCEQSFLAFVYLRNNEKMRLCLSHVKPLRSPQPERLDWSILFSLVKLFFFFFEYEHLFIDKPMVINKPAVASTRLLGLGSKLYPSSMRRMLNKDLTRFVQSLSRVCPKNVRDKTTSSQGLSHKKWEGRALGRGC